LKFSPKKSVIPAGSFWNGRFRELADYHKWEIVPSSFLAGQLRHTDSHNASYQQRQVDHRSIELVLTSHPTR